MKKVWVISAVFLCMVAVFFGSSGTSLAQVVFLTEDFEGGVPPTGWSVVNNLPWNPWTTNVALGPDNYTGGSGMAASTDSDVLGFGAYDTELRTPALDLINAVVVTLDFQANYQDFSANDAFDVDISIDGGSSWVNALHWVNDHGAFRTTPGENISLDISGIAAGESNVIIRFHNYNTIGGWDWYAQIDNVAVRGYEGICAGSVCYAYCSMACLPSHCDIYLCGASYDMPVGQITYHSGLCMGPPPPSSCLIFIPVAP